MAGAREQIESNPVLTRRFFELPNINHQTPVAPFELPETPSDLSAFLSTDEKGTTYKNCVSSIMDTLAEWAAKHNINHTACKDFKEQHLGYTGNNPEHNATNLPLYREGIASLSVISHLLHDDSIPLDFRINTIKNLFDGLLECGPGTCTNIINAHLELESCKNAAIYWMKLREDIVTEEILKKINYLNLNLELSEEEEEELNLDAMEIHYVTAVLNHFSIEIGIAPKKDDYIQYCQERLLKHLIQTIQNQLPDILSLTHILNIAFNSITRNEVRTDIYENLIADIEMIESLLKGLGIESTDYPCYNRNEIINFNLSNKKYELTWHASYSIMFSLYSRMIQQGFIDLSLESTHKINDDATIHYLPNQPLSCAYIKTKNKLTPLLTHGIEEIENIDITDFILSDHQTEYNQQEALEAITAYLLSSEAKAKHNQRILDLGHQLISRVNLGDLDTFTESLSRSPSALKLAYLINMPNEIIEILKKDPKKILTFLSHLSPEEASYFLLNRFPIKTISSIIELDHFKLILNKLEPQQKLLVISRMGESIMKLIPHHKLFIVLMKNFDNDNDKIKLVDLVARLNNSERIINSFAHLTAICLLLPQSKWQDLFSVLKLNSLMLSNTADDLSRVKGKLDPEQWKRFSNLLNTKELIPLCRNFDCLTVLLTLTPLSDWESYIQQVARNSKGYLFCKIHELPKAIKTFDPHEKSIFIELFINTLLPDIVHDITLTLDAKSQPKLQALKTLLDNLRNKNHLDKCQVISQWVAESENILCTEIKTTVLFNKASIEHDLVVALKSIFGNKPANQNQDTLNTQTDQQSTKFFGR